MRLILVIAIIFVAFGCSSQPDPIPLERLDSSYAQRGEYFVKSLAACGFCHGQEATPESPLSGGRRQVDVYGEATAPNLTPDKTGLSGWDIAKLVKAIRHSISEDESGFSPYFHRGFEWLSDRDAMSIAAYLQTLPSEVNRVEKRSVGFLTRNTIGLFKADASFVPGYVPDIPKREVTRYGQYLVNNVARCGWCHNSPSGLLQSEMYLAGGSDVVVDGETKVSPELMGPSAVSSWSEDEIVRFFRTGLTPDKREIDSKFCPINFYKMATEEDLRAIAHYLKNLPS